MSILTNECHKLLRSVGITGEEAIEIMKYLEEKDEHQLNIILSVVKILKYGKRKIRQGQNRYL